MIQLQEIIEIFKKNGYRSEQEIKGDDTELDSFDLVVLLLAIQEACEEHIDPTQGDFIETSVEHISEASVVTVKSFSEFIIKNLCR